MNTPEFKTPSPDVRSSLSVEIDSNLLTQVRKQVKNKKVTMRQIIESGLRYWLDQIEYEKSKSK